MFYFSCTRPKQPTNRLNARSPLLLQCTLNYLKLVQRLNWELAQKRGQSKNVEERSSSGGGTGFEFSKKPCPGWSGADQKIRVGQGLYNGLVSSFEKAGDKADEIRRSLPLKSALESPSRIDEATFQ